MELTEYPENCIREPLAGAELFNLNQNGSIMGFATRVWQEERVLGWLELRETGFYC
jgi:hypothetical protein